MQLHKTFGLNVRRIRRLKGLSIEALADEVGLSNTYIAQVERGERNPTLSVVERLSAVLNIPPLDLLKPPSDEES